VGKEMSEVTASPTLPSRSNRAGAVPAAVLELAAGTRLVPGGDAKPARIDGDRDHVFTLADVQRAGAEPFAGYVRR
jgi:hypothetical protein